MLIAVCSYAPIAFAQQPLDDEIAQECEQATESTVDSLSISNPSEPLKAEPESGSTQSPQSIQESPDEPSTDDTNPLLSFMDKPQKYISSGVNGLTRRIDEFFSDEKTAYETNGSYIRFTGDMVFSDDENTGFVGNTKAKIELPNTRRKLKLVFESDPDEEREDREPQLQDNIEDAAREKTYFAGFEGLWGEFKYWRVRPSLGLRVSSKLDIFARIRAHRTYEISEQWRAYLLNTLSWFNSSGYGNNLSLELDRKINEGLLFRSATSGYWKQENEFWELSQLFSLTQSISRRKALIYQMGIFGVSKPSVVSTDYLLQLRYRRLVHSDYLFLELSPKIAYERANKFEPQYSFTVRTEIVFKG